MPIYENLKTLNVKKNNTFDIFLITAISKTIASVVFYPIDTIRTFKRNSPELSILNIIKKLKFNNYYSGLNIYLFRSIPYHCSIFCTYEYLINKL